MQAGEVNGKSRSYWRITWLSPDIISHFSSDPDFSCSTSAHSRLVDNTVAIVSVVRDTSVSAVESTEYNKRAPESIHSLKQFITLRIQRITPPMSAFDLRESARCVKLCFEALASRQVIQRLLNCEWCALGHHQDSPFISAQWKQRRDRRVVQMHGIWLLCDASDWTSITLSYYMNMCLLVLHAYTEMNRCGY